MLFEDQRVLGRAGKSADIVAQSTTAAWIAAVTALLLPTTFLARSPYPFAAKVEITQRLAVLGLSPMDGFAVAEQGIPESKRTTEVSLILRRFHKTPINPRRPYLKWSS